MSTEQQATPVVVRREDYCPPDWQVEAVDLDVDIRESHVDVRARLKLHCQHQRSVPLHLDGRQLDLIGIAVNDQPWTADQYALDEAGLILSGLPVNCEVQIQTRLRPWANTSLEGLYAAGEMLCTQCEAHGFSRITYFPDRPDVLARFRVGIEADALQYPVLLSNGNRVAHESQANGRHRVIWEDPFPKPCYLFALVAGDLACIQDQYTRANGEAVAIEFYVEPGKEGLCGHAIEALKQAMAWDETTYGLAYDLDVYMVVAVSSFNMGAMENKGLNIFNDRYVLVSPETATDKDYELVTAIIGHEYFHNWTGNRVTCRDWFQLSLKEGLTVFREQQFMEATIGGATQRIEQVRMLRERQFPEDAGPLAHPVRPDSVIEINNFYTATVYEKGAELIRMLQRLLGQTAFAQGLRLYLARHDGQAATIEDFVAAMQAQTAEDLGQFMHWYSQAGSPRLQAQLRHDPDAQTLVLQVSQQTPATPGQSVKRALHIPLSVGLLDAAGQPMLDDQPRMLALREPCQVFRFDGISSPATPVFLHAFSAPVQLDYAYRPDQLALIVSHERDGYARWQAMQDLYLHHLLVEDCEVLVLQVLKGLLGQKGDPGLQAELLTPPSENQLLEAAIAPVDLDALLLARDRLQRQLGQGLHTLLSECLEASVDPSYHPNHTAKRQLQTVALHLGMQAADAEPGRALQYYENARNMTEALAALQALRDIDCPERNQALQDFRQRWHNNALVLDKWFSLQATTRFGDCAQRVRALMQDPAFELSNPNRVRSLLGGFVMHNPRALHARDESGYQLFEAVLPRLDALNPQVSARLAQGLSNWRRLDRARQASIDSLLGRLIGQPGLSRDLHEILMKLVAGNEQA